MEKTRFDIVVYVALSFRSVLLLCERQNVDADTRFYKPWLQADAEAYFTCTRVVHATCKRAHEERMRTYGVRLSCFFVIREMIAEVLTKRVLFVACDLLASTPLILQRQKRMISL